MHATPTSAPFSVALVLEPRGDETAATRTFDATLGSSWTIGPKAHGGLLLALCANAARQAFGGATPSMQPLAVSANYLSPPEPGPVQLTTTLRKRGRTVCLVDVELRQDGVSAVRATVTLGPPERGDAAFERAHPMQDMPIAPPSDAIDVSTHVFGQIVHVARVCELRVDPSTGGFLRGEVEGDPVIRLWVKPRGEAPDALFALMAGDVSPPVTLNLGRLGWAPTVQLTALLRAEPAPGWLRVQMSTSKVGA
ncbi:MAG: thioesterase family protein, partial [Mycobacteriaceae bacterium]